MEGRRERPPASRAKKPAAKRTTTEHNGTVAARSHARSRGPQRGARSRGAEPDGDPMEKPTTRARPRQASMRIKDLRSSATGAAGVAEQPASPELQPPAIQPPASPELQPPISAPNEFDVMFKLEVPRIDLQEYHDTGAFYLVKFKRIPRGNPLSHFLEEEILSASKMLSKFREIIKEEVKEIKDSDICVEEEKPGSPAVTLLIRNPEEISVDIILALESKSSWPISTKEGLPIKNWLGTKMRTSLRREPFYLVPKDAKVGNSFQGKTWRLSFSHIEKYILKNHGIEKTCCEVGGAKCCRKDCLKLMKYLLEQLKKEYQELEAFCSYHVKTAILHMWTEHPQDREWDPKHLSRCFDNFVTFFVECLRTEKLLHYFIPKFNLFSQELIDQKSKEFLIEKIEYERNNGFPIFDKF
ncbi:cyclic GMP-AMP synthase [Microtus ochrogaster]|uniref:Cyclic GMP-AMP synthase n=1 Tax=Microtus ochrogaster TaxID=79684 RepID=A0ABM0KJT6_MICOH|nr:cyclic GMP-AMP synthase [Microtus ochrogaster]